MKTWIASVLTLISLQIVSVAGEVPATLAAYFDKDVPVKAQIISITPPAEFEPFVQKISEVAQKDTEWFTEHSKKTPAGSPIPLFDAKLGMTQAEYDQYVKFWAAREVKKVADTGLVLQEQSDGIWKINGAGAASSLVLLSYDEKTKNFTSPNGELEAIKDVAAPADSLLGAWGGQEWRYLSENSLTKMKENIALGKSADGKYSFLIYRIQEVTAAGRPLFDKSLMIRFAAKKSK